jgi:2-dehydropantoate 2-reductase
MPGRIRPAGGTIAQNRLAGYSGAELAAGPLVPQTEGGREMRIAVMGAGGIGGFYGGRLARAGGQIIFIARGAHLRALKEKGLRVQSAVSGDFALPAVEATDDPATVGPVELVLMCVKAYDLEAAAQAILPMLAAETAVIPLLNGADIAERVAAVVGAEHVLGGTTYTNANIVAPGTIRHLAMDRLIFGELEGGSSARGEAIRHVLAGAGIGAELSADVRKEIWVKYVALVAMSGVASVLRVPGRAVMADPDARALLEAAMREVMALGEREGIAFDPGLIDHLLDVFDNQAPQYKPSLLLDLEQGRKLEVEALQGTAVRLGEKLGVPTPISRFLYTALKPHANGAPVS